jgi:hypothetical protein
MGEIRSITAETLRDLTSKLNDLRLTKDKIIEIDYTGDEKFMWVCLYQS